MAHGKPRPERGRHFDRKRGGAAIPAFPTTNLRKRYLPDVGYWQDIGGTTPATAQNHPVARWDDQVGTDHLLLDVATNPMLLLLDELDGYSAVGSEALMLRGLNSNAGVDPCTLVILGRFTDNIFPQRMGGYGSTCSIYNDTGTGFGYFQDADGGSITQALGGDAFGTYNLLILPIDAAAPQTWSMNGVQSVDTVQATAATVPLAIGFNGTLVGLGEFSSSDIIEIAEFTGMIDGTVRDGILAYFQAKYPTLGLP